MKTTDEECLIELEKYIKECQLNEGRSPSFRQIQKKMGYGSIVTAQRHVKILVDRGLIKKDNNDKSHYQCA